MSISGLTLRNLEYVVAVADEGHFGRAAEKCAVSQPALSAQIRKVEQGLGVQIFERNRRGLHLTTVGVQVVEQARLVLLEAGRLEEIVRRKKRLLSGRFRLGMIATLGPYLLPHLLHPLRERHPDLELILVEGLTDPLLEQLRVGRLDAVLASLPLPLKAFHVERLFVEPFYLAVPADHRLASAQPLRLDMLDADQMLLLEDGHCLRDQALEVCPALDRNHRDRFQATSLETLRHMVASGAGYTLMPVLAVPTADRLRKLVRYRPFRKNSPSRVVGLVWRRGSGPEQDAEALAALVRENLPPRVKSVQ